MEVKGKPWIYGVSCEDPQRVVDFVAKYPEVEAGAVFPGIGIWKGTHETCAMIHLAWPDSPFGTAGAFLFAELLRVKFGQEAVYVSDGTTAWWV